MKSSDITSNVFRIIDASFNRASEGLRVLEDIARMILNDAALSEQLKNLRHRLNSETAAFYQELLQSRNSEGDVGKDIEVQEIEKGKEIPSVLVANAKRVQESLRTLEEMAKIPDVSQKLNYDTFKQLRFEIYTVEKQLMGKLAAKD